MAIDLKSEQVIPLAKVADLPFVRGPHGPPNHSTIWRWATKGCRGAKLESVVVGRRLQTTVEAVQRFVSALQQA